MSHDNLQVGRAKGVTKAKVQESLDNDGTLLVRVTAEFVVHHAAYEPITYTTLAGLIEDQGVTEQNIHLFKIIEANNE